MKCLEAGILNQPVIDEMELEIKKIVDEAVEFAEHSPEPPADFLYENVYS